MEDFYYYLPDASDWSFMEVEDEGPKNKNKKIIPFENAASICLQRLFL